MSDWLFQENLQVEHGKSEHRHWSLHIQIILDTKCQHKLIILIFWTKFAPKMYSGQKQKSEHHHWILHIRTNVGTKYHFKQFWNLPEKGISGQKRKK